MKILKEFQEISLNRKNLNMNNNKDNWYPPDWIEIPLIIILFGMMMWGLCTIIYWTKTSQCEESVTLVKVVQNQGESLKEFFKNLHIK